MSGVSIRAACPDDVVALESALEQGDYFKDRLRRQDEGRGTLLVALLNGKIVGDVYVWLDEAEESVLRMHLPGVPLLTHLEVLPEYRNQRIGTALIHAVETLLWQNKYRQVALAVDVGNNRAADLYTRLGYRWWKRGKNATVTCYHDEIIDGEVKSVSERCHVMVKSLPNLSKAITARSGRDGAAAPGVPADRGDGAAVPSNA